MDFADNFALVVTDINFSLMLSRKLIENCTPGLLTWNGILYGELEDEIYMETLAGYVKCEHKIEEDKVFILDKGIYDFSASSLTVLEEIY